MKYIFWEHDNCQEMSGLPKLIYMCVETMSKSAEVMLISHPDSIVFQKLRKKGVNFLFEDERYVKDSHNIYQDDILISDRINKNLIKLHRQNPRIIIWRIIPGVYNESLFSRLLQRIQFKKVAKEHALIAMDDMAHHAVERVTGLKLPRVIVPVPICRYEYNYSPKEDEDYFNISYLGRAVDWKIYPVIRLVQDLGEIKGRIFNLHIFTDSPQIFNNLLNPFVKENTVIKYHKGYYDNKLVEALINMQLHYAMGISVLEGASVGVPTVNAPVAKELIPDGYKYHFMYEDKDNAVSNSWEEDMKKGLGISLSQIISLLSTKEKQMDISQKCKMASERYSTESIVDMLKQIPTTLHVRDCNYRMISYWKNRINCI